MSSTVASQKRFEDAVTSAAKRLSDEHHITLPDVTVRVDPNLDDLVISSSPRPWDQDGKYILAFRGDLVNASDALINHLAVFGLATMAARYDDAKWIDQHDVHDLPDSFRQQFEQFDATKPQPPWLEDHESPFRQWAESGNKSEVFANAQKVVEGIHRSLLGEPELGGNVAARAEIRRYQTSHLNGLQRTMRKAAEKIFGALPKPRSKLFQRIAKTFFGELPEPKSRLPVAHETDSVLPLSQIAGNSREARQPPDSRGVEVIDKQVVRDPTPRPQRTQVEQTM